MIDKCPQCGSIAKFDTSPGAGPHRASLRCSDCHRFIKWLGSSDGKKTEKTIQGEILVALTGLTWLRIWRNNTGVGRALTNDQIVSFGCKGSADLLGLLHDGRFLAIEVKRHNGRPSKAQIAWGDMVRSMGGMHIIAKSASDVRDTLTAAGYPKGNR